MATLCSAEDLQTAWKNARRDAADNFVFDVIGYEDVERNIPYIARRLELEIKGDQYTPAPLLSVDVPKRPYSVRPGAVVSPLDLIVLYALVRKIAPALDAKLSPSVYSYRWLPEAKSPGRPLFGETDQDGDPAYDVVPHTQFAPYPPFAEVAPAGWFRGWIEFRERAKEATSRYEYCAVGDVTAYFENVAVTSLFDRISSILGDEHADAVALLRQLYEFWGWQPAATTARGKVLPQGNDISLFLSNFFLTDLDKTVTEVVGGDARRYLRYVDDICIFSGSREEGHRALLACDHALRKLNLSLNTEKTEVLTARELFDEDTEGWIEKMSPLDANAVENAREFLSGGYDLNDETWERPYLRALTTLQHADDDLAVPAALETFLDNPSFKLLVKNFDYLSYFAPNHKHAEELAAKLTRKAFTFPYHKHYLYRLGAYGREDSPALRATALHDARRGDAEWYVRMAALFCLNSFRLSAYELEEIEELAERESHPLVVRAALVALRQRPLDEFSSAWDQILFTTAPGQENLREYFFRVLTEEDLARTLLGEISDTAARSRAFVNRLHQLDLLKSNAAVREDLLAVLERKMDECDSAWYRLRDRLAGIKESASEDALRHSEKRKADQALGHLETVLRGSREAVIITGAAGEIQIWNDAARDLLGYAADEALGRELTRLVEPAGGFKSAAELLAFVAESGGSLTEEVVPHRRRDGTFVTLSATYSAITGPSGEAAGLTVLLRDVTAEIRAAKVEQFEAETEKLLSEISGRFVAPKDLGEAITRTLDDTAKLLEAKRAYLFRLREDGESLTATHEWAAPGVSLLRETGHNIELKRLALFKYELLDRHAVVVGDAQTLPPGEKAAMQKRGARASLGVPFYVRGSLAGLVGCDDVNRPRTWEPEEVNLIFSVTALVSKALERKDAEEALRESEDRRRGFMDSATSAFSLWNSDLRLTDINKIGLSYFPAATTKEDLLGKHLAEISPALEKTDLYRQYLKVIETGKPYAVDDVPPHSGFGDRYVSIKAFKVGAGLGIVATDETERKRAGDKIRQAEREKEAILEGMSETVVYHDSDMRILWVNAAGSVSLTSKPEDLVGRHCYEVWHGRDEPCDGCPVKKALLTGEPHEGETRTPDGREWLVRGYPLGDADGKVTNAVEMATDITERRRAEKALRASERMLRARSQATPIPTITFRKAGDEFILTDVNAAARELNGVEDPGPAGKPADELFDDTPEIAEDLRTCFNEKRRLKKDRLFKLGATGDPRYISFYYAFVPPDRVLVHLVDLTDRKRAEEALERRSEEITAVNELAIELAAAASTAEMFAKICAKLKEITGALATLTASYDEATDELAINYIVAETKVIKKGNKILGIDVRKLRFPAERYEPEDKASDRVVISEGLPDQAAKVFPKKVCRGIERAFNVGATYELLFHHAGKMMGTAEVVMRKGCPPLSVDTLEAFAHVAAAALRRKRAEEARAESEERYRSLIDTMSEGFVIQDKEGVITYVNDRFCEMVGYAREELVGRPAAAFVERTDAETRRDRAAKPRITRGGNYDVVWTGKDKRRAHTIVSPAVLRNGGGGYAGSYATITDITDRKRAEDAVRRRSEEIAAVNQMTLELTAAATTAEIRRIICERLRDITGALATAVTSYDPETDTLALQHIAAEKSVRTKAHDFFAKELRRLDFPLRRVRPEAVIPEKVATTDGVPNRENDTVPEPLARALRKAFGQGELYTLSLQHAGELMGVAVTVTPDGASPLSADTLQLVANAGAAALRRAKGEEDVRENEEKYRTLVERSLHGIVIADRESVVFANNAVAEITGYATDELVGLKPERIAALVIHPEDRRALLKRFRARLEGKCPPAHYKLRGVRKDGSTMWLELFSDLISFRNRPAIQAVVIDVTDRKRTQEEQRRRTEGYKALNELALELADAASYDEMYKLIGDRLRAITGATAVAVNVLDADARVLEVKYINTSSKLLSKADEILGTKIRKLILPVRERDVERIRREKVTRVRSIADISFGVIPGKVADRLKKALRLGDIYGVALHHRGEVIGAAMAFMATDDPPLSFDELRIFGNQAATALARKRAEEELTKHVEPVREAAETGAGKISKEK